MIAAQQARIGANDFWALKPALLKIDRGAVTVRRRMDALIAAEIGAGLTKPRPHSSRAALAAGS